MTTRTDSLAAAREKIDHIGGPTTEYEIDCLISVVGHLADAVEAGPDNGLTAAQKQVVSDGRKAAEKREKALAEARREGVMKGCAWAAEEVLNWWTSNPQGSLNALLGNIRRGPQPDAAPPDKLPLPWESCPVCNPVTALPMEEMLADADGLEE